MRWRRNNRASEAEMPSPTPLWWDDSELIEAAMTGNADAWRELRRMIQPIASDAVRRYRLVPHLAEDITQATVVSLVKDDYAALHRIEKRDKLRGYLGTIANRAARQYQGGTWREQTLLFESPGPGIDVSGIEIEEMIQQLPISVQDKKLVRWYGEGYSEKETAGLLSREEHKRFEPPAIRQRFTRIRDRAKRRGEQER